MRHYWTLINRLMNILTVLIAIGLIVLVMWREQVWLINLFAPVLALLIRQLAFMLRPVVMSVILRPLTPVLVLIGVAALGSTWWGQIKQRIDRITRFSKMKKWLRDWWTSEWSATKMTLAVTLFAVMLGLGFALHIVVLWFPVGPLLIRSFYVRISGVVIARVVNPLYRYVGKAAKKNGYLQPVYVRLRKSFAILVISVRKLRRRLRRQIKLHPVSS